MTRGTRFITFIFLALVSAGAGRAAAETTQADLDAVTARAKALYQYDINAARATDAVLATVGKPSGPFVYVGRLGDDGTWTFDFGIVDASGSFLVSTEVTRKIDDESFRVIVSNPPRLERDFLASAAQALKKVDSDFVPASGYLYNYAVLPAPEGQFYIYIYPAQRKGRMYPLGADERYLFSANGATIVTAHRMHRSIIFDTPTQLPEGQTAIGLVHNDIYGDIPEDTDVLHVLMGHPPLAELVKAGGHLFKIEVDGKITDSGPMP